MPIDLWGSLPSTDDRTPRERREAEGRRRAFDESSLLPAIDARFCPTCKVNVRKGDGVECSSCVLDGRVLRTLTLHGQVFVARASAQTRASADRLVAAGVARWATASEFVRLDPQRRTKQQARGSMIVKVPT